VLFVCVQDIEQRPLDAALMKMTASRSAAPVLRQFFSVTKLLDLQVRPGFTKRLISAVLRL
jgi:hypothetical protein